MKLSIFLTLAGVLALPSDHSRAPSDYSRALGIFSKARSSLVHSSTIQQRYIVTFNDQSITESANHLEYLESVVDLTTTDLEPLDIPAYHGDGLLGYHGFFDESTVSLLQQDARVKAVEPDTETTISLATMPANISYVGERETAPTYEWGLSRISHRDNQINRTCLVNCAGRDYPHLKSRHPTVIYIVDTGVRVSHSEFGGRAVQVKNFNPTEDDQDNNGHGTHVAGTLIGSRYGVSRTHSTLKVVKVFGKNGAAPVSNIAAAIAWVAQDHLENPGQRAVLNFSAGGPKIAAYDTVFKAAVNAGIAVAVAAGNGERDACVFGPANNGFDIKGLVVVGATDMWDNIAVFPTWWGSNWGKCVNVFAPGSYIESTYNTDDGATFSSSGTSMAVPHVAGLMAYYQSVVDRHLSPAELEDMVTAVPNYVRGELYGAPNYLANNRISEATVNATAVMGYMGLGGNHPDHHYVDGFDYGWDV